MCIPNLSYTNERSLVHDGENGARIITLSAYWLLYWLLRTSPNSVSLENFITTNRIVNRRARGLK